MKIRKTRKRKLYLNDISRCNPQIKKGTRKGTRCLPQKVYNSVKKMNGKSVYESIGCKEGEDHCLLDKLSLDSNTKAEIRKHYLRPRYPKEWLNDPDMWLDNFNIEHTMKQYSDAYPWFKFLGTFPIDFSAPNPYKKEGGAQCLNNDICVLHLHEEHKKGTRGIGIIFNLDPHFKSGSHWVGLYIDIKNIKKSACYYFDSYGYEVPTLIARLMRSFRLQIPGIQLGYNARRFQYGGSECGMFSIYFIICMLSGIPFKEFCKDAVNDDFMLKLRHIIFSK